MTNWATTKYNINQKTIKLAKKTIEIGKYSATVIPIIKGIMSRNKGMRVKLNT